MLLKVSMIKVSVNGSREFAIYFIAYIIKKSLEEEYMCSTSSVPPFTITCFFFQEM